MRLIVSLVAVIAAACAGPMDEGAAVRFHDVDGGRALVDGAMEETTEERADASTPEEIPAEICESFRVLSEGSAPRVLLLMDASASMVNFWPSATESVGRVVNTLGGNVSFGVGHFGHNGCDDAAFPVAPNLQQSEMIMSSLSTVRTQGATPTAHALGAVADLKEGKINRATGTSLKDLDAVILVTDGLPNCNYGSDSATCDCTLGAGAGACNGYPELCSDADRALGGIQRLRDLGVETHIIGFNTAGIPLSEMTLGAMAKAGSVQGKFYTAATALELEGQLRTASTEIKTCDYLLASEPEDPAYVRVTFEGTDIPSASVYPQGGWSLDGRTISLNGVDCDKVRAARNPDLVISVECEPVAVR